MMPGEVGVGDLGGTPTTHNAVSSETALSPLISSQIFFFPGFLGLRTCAEKAICRGGGGGGFPELQPH